MGDGVGTVVFSTVGPSGPDSDIQEEPSKFLAVSSGFELVSESREVS